MFSERKQWPHTWTKDVQTFTSQVFLSFHQAEWYHSLDHLQLLPKTRSPPPYLPLFCASLFYHHSSLQPEQCPKDGKASINNTNTLLVNVAFPHTTLCALLQSPMNLWWHGMTQTCWWQMVKWSGWLWHEWRRSGCPHAACSAPLLQEVQPGRAVSGRPLCTWEKMYRSWMDAHGWGCPGCDEAEGLCSESFYLGYLLRAYIGCWKPEETGEVLLSLPGRLGEERVSSMEKLHWGHMAALLKNEDRVPPRKPGTMLMASQAPTMQNAMSPAAAPSLSYHQGHVYHFVQTQGPVPVNCPALSDQYQWSYIPCVKHQTKDSSMALLSPTHWLMADLVFT